MKLNLKKIAKSIEFQSLFLGVVTAVVVYIVAGLATKWLGGNFLNVLSFVIIMYLVMNGRKLDSILKDFSPGKTKKEEK